MKRLDYVEKTFNGKKISLNFSGGDITHDNPDKIGCDNVEENSLGE